MTDPACPHEHLIQRVVPDAPDFCPECVAKGQGWVHLRVCLVCGHVGCCDASPGRHARRHFHATGHPVMQSYEIGESWRYCFIDDTDLPPGEPLRSA